MSNMSNTRHVYVGIYFRDEFSIGDNRRRLGYAAFHWGIIMQPKVLCGPCSYAFDVSNGVRLDPNTMTDLNPNRAWYFRSRPNVNPNNSTHLLGGIMIGQVPDDTGYSELEARLRSISGTERGRS